MSKYLLWDKWDIELITTFTDVVFREEDGCYTTTLEAARKFIKEDYEELKDCGDLRENETLKDYARARYIIYKIEPVSF